MITSPGESLERPRPRSSLERQYRRCFERSWADFCRRSLFRTVITSSIQQDLGKVRSILAHHAKTGETLDLSSLFFAYTLSAFSRMAFSVDLETLQETTIVPVAFAQAFDYAQKVMATRFNDPFWPIKEKFSEEGRQMRAAIKVLDEFSYKIIEQRESEGIVGLEKDEAGKTDLLSLYMALRDESGKPMSKQALRDAVLNLIIAGVRSSSLVFSIDPSLTSHLLSSETLPLRLSPGSSSTSSPTPNSSLRSEKRSTPSNRLTTTRTRICLKHSPASTR